MRRVVKYALIGVVALVGLVVWLLESAFERDQENFRAAKNKCEVGCVQDSGGIEPCRALCAQHPDRYP